MISPAQYHFAVQGFVTVLFFAIFAAAAVAVCIQNHERLRNKAWSWFQTIAADAGTVILCGILWCAASLEILTFP